jgi:hypothetical protein
MSQTWHYLTTSDPYLSRSHSVRLYFDDLNRQLFKMRYDTKARFEQAVGECYGSFGLYGNATLYVGSRTRNPLDPTGGLFYKSCNNWDVFYLVDDEGRVSVVFRRMFLNARQFKVKFPERDFPKNLSESGKELTNTEVVHVAYVRSNQGYREGSLGPERFPVGSFYISIEDNSFIGEEAGYRSLPYLIPRIASHTDNLYGFSPGMQALPALATASQVKKSYIIQGQRATSQVLLAADKMKLNSRIDLRPGSVNYGGVDSQGRMLLQALPSGDFRVAESLLADERNDIEDSFFVNLFQILTENPQMTATEVVERMSEKASLLAPVMGRLQSEFLGPLIERELDVLADSNMLPEPPPEFIEAGADYEIVYSSPLAKSQQTESVSGYMRVFELAMQSAQATGDASPLDHFDFDKAIPAIADVMGADSAWFRNPEAIEQIRQGRAKQQSDQKLLEAAPSLASVAKTVEGAGNVRG